MTHGIIVLIMYNTYCDILYFVNFCNFFCSSWNKNFGSLGDQSKLRFGKLIRVSESRREYFNDFFIFNR